jgi:AraC family transcriptional regulator
MALSANSLQDDAIVGNGRIIGCPPGIMGEPFRDAVRVTRRWNHGALYDSLDAFPDNVVMTYYGVDRDVAWRSGGRRLASRTRSGAITVIPEGHDGRWDMDGPVETSHVYIPDRRLQAAAAQITGGGRVELVGRVGFEDPSAARILELLSREVPNQDPSARLFVDQAIDLLCIHLVRAHSSFGALALEAPRGGLADWQLRRVTQYMREHLAEEIGLDELAALVNLSRFHFCTAFRKATGQTPHNWLMILRIEEARRLLETPALAVTDVALAVGYQTPSSFAAAFRKLVGMTPSAYRRAL